MAKKITAQEALDDIYNNYEDKQYVYSVKRRAARNTADIVQRAADNITDNKAGNGKKILEDDAKYFRDEAEYAGEIERKIGTQKRQRGK